jgi:hypothetical protein
MTDEEIIEFAEDFCSQCDGIIRLDDDHEIERVHHPKGAGAWIRAWIWVTDESDDER